MKRLRWIALALAALACGKPASERVTLHVMHWAGYLEKDWHEKIIGPFEKSHPNIHVELEIVPYGLYVQRLLTAAAAGGKTADVMMVDDWMGAEIFKSDFALDLEDRAKKDLRLDSFNTNLIAEWRRLAGGRLHGIPHSIGGTVLFYNKALFDSAHVAYPDTSWTYESLLAAAKKITRDVDGDGKPDVWGLIADNGTNTGLDSYVYSSGAKEITDDFSRTTLADEATVKAIEWWVDLVRKHKVAPQPSGVMNQFSQMFSTGRVGMMLLGDHFANFFKDKQFAWDYTLPPRGSATRLARSFDDGLVIPKTCENPDAAWEFVKWVATFPPVEGVRSILDKSTPAYVPLSRSASWEHDVGAAHAPLLRELFAHCSFAILSNGWYHWRESAFIPEIDNAMLGKKEVGEAMHDAAVKADGVLQKR